MWKQATTRRDDPASSLFQEASHQEKRDCWRDISASLDDDKPLTRIIHDGSSRLQQKRT
jgi:hypothetical protein